MKRATRWLAFGAALTGLMLIGLPSSADHATRTDVRNIEAVADLPNTNTLANSDMAFWGDLAFQGNWDGWTVHDISDPTSPTTILDYEHCSDPAAGLGGGQGDIIVWQNLLVRAWNGSATASAVCGTDANGDPIPIARTGFEGIHIFDISNVTQPQLIASVDIDTDAADKPPGITQGCGAHTLTAVPDPASNTLYAYVGGSSFSAMAAGNCPGMDLVEIPLNNPAAAEWYGRAEAVPAEAELGRSCHDITVYMIDKNRAVCSGSWTDTDPDPVVSSHGFAYWSMDAADGGSLREPVLLYQKDIPGTRTVGHTSAFSWDGKILSWVAEPGGGVEAACEITDPVIDRQMFLLAAETGSLKGTWTIPTQGSDESCSSVHIMQSIPTTNGLDVFSSGNYMAGTYMIDYTDPTGPSAIGWSDPPPDQPGATFPILGGAWATYWYNGYLYESNIKKGLFISRSTSPQAQTAVRFDFLNPQTMMPLPSVPGRCKGVEATLVGTTASDIIRGTSGRDVIVGLTGKDRIIGLRGADLICAGPGKDKVSGGGGDDRIFGQGGNDNLRGGGGDDFLNGGGGRKDRCHGGPGTNTARKCEKEIQIG